MAKALEKVEVEGRTQALARLEIAYILWWLVGKIAETLPEEEGLLETLRVATLYTATVRVAVL